MYTDGSEDSISQHQAQQAPQQQQQLQQGQVAVEAGQPVAGSALPAPSAAPTAPGSAADVAAAGVTSRPPPGPPGIGPFGALELQLPLASEAPHIRPHVHLMSPSSHGLLSPSPTGDLMALLASPRHTSLSAAASGGSLFMNTSETLEAVAAAAAAELQQRRARRSRSTDVASTAQGHPAHQQQHLHGPSAGLQQQLSGQGLHQGQLLQQGGSLTHQQHPQHIKLEQQQPHQQLRFLQDPRPTLDLPSTLPDASAQQQPAGPTWLSGPSSAPAQDPPTAAAPPPGPTQHQQQLPQQQEQMQAQQQLWAALGLDRPGSSSSSGRLQQYPSDAQWTLPNAPGLTAAPGAAEYSQGVQLPPAVALRPPAGRIITGQLPLAAPSDSFSSGAGAGEGTQQQGGRQQQQGQQGPVRTLLPPVLHQQFGSVTGPLRLGPSSNPAAAGASAAAGATEADTFDDSAAAAVAAGGNPAAQQTQGVSSMGSPAVDAAGVASPRPTAASAEDQAPAAAARPQQQQQQHVQVFTHTRHLSCKTYLKRLNVTQFMSDHMLPCMEGSARTSSTRTTTTRQPQPGAAAAADSGPGQESDTDLDQRAQGSSRTSSSSRGRGRQQGGQQGQRSYELLFKVQVKLVDTSGHAWPVIYEGVMCAGQRHLRLTCGWSEFIKARKLGIGDSITFERRGENRSALAVYVQQAGREPETPYQGELPEDPELKVVIGSVRGGAAGGPAAAAAAGVVCGGDIVSGDSSGGAVSRGRSNRGGRRASGHRSSRQQQQRRRGKRQRDYDTEEDTEEEEEFEWEQAEQEGVSSYSTGRAGGIHGLLQVEHSGSFSGGPPPAAADGGGGGSGGAAYLQSHRYQQQLQHPRRQQQQQLEGVVFGAAGSFSSGGVPSQHHGAVVSPSASGGASGGAGGHQSMLAASSFSGPAGLDPAAAAAAAAAEADGAAGLPGLPSGAPSKSGHSQQAQLLWTSQQHHHQQQQQQQPSVSLSSLHLHSPVPGLQSWPTDPGATAAATAAGQQQRRWQPPSASSAAQAAAAAVAGSGAGAPGRLQRLGELAAYNRLAAAGSGPSPSQLSQQQQQHQQQAQQQQVQMLAARSSSAPVGGLSLPQGWQVSTGFLGSSPSAQFGSPSLSSQHQQQQLQLPGHNWQGPPPAAGGAGDAAAAIAAAIASSNSWTEPRGEALLALRGGGGGRTSSTDNNAAARAGLGPSHAGLLSAHTAATGLGGVPAFAAAAGDVARGGPTASLQLLSSGAGSGQYGQGLAGGGQAGSGQGLMQQWSGQGPSSRAETAAEILKRPRLSARFSGEALQQLNALLDAEGPWDPSLLTAGSGGAADAAPLAAAAGGVGFGGSAGVGAGQGHHQGSFQQGLGASQGSATALAARFAGQLQQPYYHHHQQQQQQPQQQLSALQPPRVDIWSQLEAQESAAGPPHPMGLGTSGQGPVVAGWQQGQQALAALQQLQQEQLQQQQQQQPDDGWFGGLLSP